MQNIDQRPDIASPWAVLRFRNPPEFDRVVDGAPSGLDLYPESRQKRVFDEKVALSQLI